MKFLQVNKFLYPKGGAEITMLTIKEMLMAHGHETVLWGMAHPNNPPLPFAEFFVSYVDYHDASLGLSSKARAAMNIVYSFEARRNFVAMLKQVRPDFLILHNFYHQISPAFLGASISHRIPTIMFLHDFKAVCPVYLMLCKGKVCEKCKNGRFYYCGVNRCTNGSFLKSMVNVAEMYLHHGLLHICDKIDVFISPSRFLKKKVGQMGMKGEVVHLPNCVDLARFEPCYESQEKSIVYAGRLSHEKGVGTLIRAVKEIPSVRLKIIGDGPLRPYLEEKVRTGNIGNVAFLGYRTGQDLHDEIRRSMFLVAPSEWYENNPRTVIEAFALGKPVLGARIGGIPELVRDWETGLTHRPGDVNDLKEKISLMASNISNIYNMGQTARKYIENHLNTEVYYWEFMNILQKAAEKKSRVPA